MVSSSDTSTHSMFSFPLIAHEYISAAAREEKIKTIFIAKGFPTKAAQTIAKETGANVVKIDILSEQWDKSMREIIDEIAKSMK